jgi:hypothetical protein
VVNASVVGRVCRFQLTYSKKLSKIHTSSRAPRLAIAHVPIPSSIQLNESHNTFWGLVKGGGGVDRYRVACARYGMHACDWSVKLHAACTGDVFGKQASKSPEMQISMDRAFYSKWAMANGINEGRGPTLPFGTQHVGCGVWNACCSISLCHHTRPTHDTRRESVLQNCRSEERS